MEEPGAARPGITAQLIAVPSEIDQAACSWMPLDEKQRIIDPTF
jgi:hypothetical protein